MPIGLEGGGEEAEWPGRPISSAVERLPYKQDVAGSKPASGIRVENFRAGLRATSRQVGRFALRCCEI